MSRGQTTFSHTDFISNSFILPQYSVTGILAGQDHCYKRAGKILYAERPETELGENSSSPSPQEASMRSLRYVDAGTFHKVAKFSQSILDTWMPRLLQVVLPSRAESTGEFWFCWGPIIDWELICFLPPRQDCN